MSAPTAHRHLPACSQCGAQDMINYKHRVADGKICHACCMTLNEKLKSAKCECCGTTRARSEMHRSRYATDLLCGQCNERVNRWEEGMILKGGNMTARRVVLLERSIVGLVTRLETAMAQGASSVASSKQPPVAHEWTEMSLRPPAARGM